MKGHLQHAMVNSLRDAAIKFHGLAQLRERLSRIVNDYTILDMSGLTVKESIASKLVPGDQVIFEGRIHIINKRICLDRTSEMEHPEWPAIYNAHEGHIHQVNPEHLDTFKRRLTDEEVIQISYYLDSRHRLLELFLFEPVDRVKEICDITLS